jgi:hypothetical protein
LKTERALFWWVDQGRLKSGGGDLTSLLPLDGLFLFSPDRLRWFPNSTRTT